MEQQEENRDLVPLGHSSVVTDPHNELPALDWRELQHALWDLGDRLHDVMERFTVTFARAYEGLTLVLRQHGFGPPTVWGIDRPYRWRGTPKTPFPPGHRSRLRLARAAARLSTQVPRHPGKRRKV